METKPSYEPGTVGYQILVAIANGHNTVSALHQQNFAKGTVGNYLRRFEKHGIVSVDFARLPRPSFKGETRCFDTKVYKVLVDFPAFSQMQ